MTIREELLATAMVGTAQKEFDLPGTEFDNLARTLSRIDKTDKEKLLLSTAGVFYSWQTAGTTSAHDRLSVPERAEDETREILPPNLMRIFAAMLDSQNKILLHEFLNLAARKKKIFPPESLPVLLDAEYQSANFQRLDIRHLKLPVLGNRGRWLAKLRSQWRWALVEKDFVELWETGTTGERIFALEYLRMRDPHAARILLQSVWKSESARERQKFLEVLKINSSVEDEEFLDEIWLQDKSLEVRRTAFEMLANLPDSKLTGNIEKIVRPVITVKKKWLSKAEIEVNLPADWKEKTRDLEAVAKLIFQNPKYFGEKAMALALVLSLVTPKFWENAFNLKAKDIVPLMHKSDWARALLAGVGMAAIRFENADWFAEILSYNNKFALSISPLLAWSETSYSFLHPEKILKLIRGNFENGFVLWLILNREPDFHTSDIDFFRRSKNLLVSYAQSGGNRVWLNLPRIVPAELVGEWIQWLEELKNNQNSDAYHLRFIDQWQSVLRMREEYLTEFEKEK